MKSLDDEKLTELEAIWRESTPGPWQLEKQSDCEFWINAPKGDMRLGHKAWDGMIVTYGDEDVPVAAHRVAKANASMIMAAKTVMPLMIEEIRKLRREVAKCHSSSPDEVERAWLDGMRQGMAEMQKAAIKALETSYDAGAAKLVSRIRVHEE